MKSTDITTESSDNIICRSQCLVTNSSLVKNIVFNFLPMFKIVRTAVSLKSGKKMFSTFETLKLTSPKEYVVQVELNRPAQLNAFNRAMWM